MAIAWSWKFRHGGSVETSVDGTVKLDVDTALRLAYIHSPSHQMQLETLYLSALDVSAERFEFDTQFFGGYGARYAHVGGLNPPGFRFDPVTDRAPACICSGSRAAIVPHRSAKSVRSQGSRAG
jgi:hypothetical protein